MCLCDHFVHPCGHAYLLLKDPCEPDRTFLNCPVFHYGTLEFLNTSPPFPARNVEPGTCPICDIPAPLDDRYVQLVSRHRIPGHRSIYFCFDDDGMANRYDHYDRYDERGRHRYARHDRLDPDGGNYYRSVRYDNQVTLYNDGNPGNQLGLYNGGDRVRLYDGAGPLFNRSNRFGPLYNRGDQFGSFYSGSNQYGSLFDHIERYGLDPNIVDQHVMCRRRRTRSTHTRRSRYHTPDVHSTTRYERNERYERNYNRGGNQCGSCSVM
ncbi:hypothetical protein EJ06DRAFT_34934 [Trichodelitschia bisporula]|uniref:Uncharacterized protein n=1 Tax=Trichodelitschia bisporula TaxID=703511 RepID=A0A6G1HV92_9PEZI|nr:hypothetical protein EJ06DRAFT_34934 [Trichodelitschia bisporula]